MFVVQGRSGKFGWLADAVLQFEHDKKIVYGMLCTLSWPDLGTSSNSRSPSRANVVLVTIQWDIKRSLIMWTARPFRASLHHRPGSDILQLNLRVENQSLPLLDMICTCGRTGLVAHWAITRTPFFSRRFVHSKLEPSKNRWVQRQACEPQSSTICEESTVLLEMLRPCGKVTTLNDT